MAIRIIVCLLLLACSRTSTAQQKQIDYEALYSKCLSDSGGINNGSVDACSSHTSAAAKKEITSLYKTIYDKFFAELPDEALKFEQTQRAWITYRNGQCSLAGSHVGSLMHSYCPMKLNIARVIELRELAGE
jgi:uncharacterized protein YecT (DUF1311 family)